MMTYPSALPDANHVELSFMDSRAKLLDVAAFLDRVQRFDQESDYRVKALKDAIAILQSETPDRAKRVLLHFSDMTEEPIPEAHTQGAAGAVDPTLVANQS